LFPVSEDNVKNMAERAGNKTTKKGKKAVLRISG